MEDLIKPWRNTETIHRDEIVWRGYTYICSNCTRYIDAGVTKCKCGKSIDWSSFIDIGEEFISEKL